MECIELTSGTRPLTANDVDNVVNAIIGAHGELTTDMHLALEAFDDGRISPAYTVDYLLLSEAELLASQVQNT